MEALTGFTVIQESVTVFWNSRLVTIISDFVNRSTIKNGCREFHSQFLSRPSKNSFIDLSKVHTAWHPKWIKDNINRSSVFKEGHVFFTNDLRNDTFITMTTSHLISHFQFAFN